MNELTTDLKTLYEATLNNLKSSKANNTLRAYKSDFKDFGVFCARHGLNSLPTEPKIVSLYLTHLSKKSSKNLSLAGAYEVLRTSNKISATIIATGSETSLAIDVSHKLATDGIYSKVISMPCQELFDQQSEVYKNKILNETKLIVSIEASETGYWKKYTGRKGLNFGIDDFGKSAPYKDIYNHFGLSSEMIVKKIKKRL